MKLLSPGKIEGGTSRFGLTDGNGAGILVSEGEGGAFTVDVEPDDLHYIVEAGVCLVLTRIGQNHFELTVRPPGDSDEQV